MKKSEFKALIKECYKEIQKESKEYDDFFTATLKRFGVESQDDLEGDKKKEFFDYIDKNWTAKKETD